MQLCSIWPSPFPGRSRKTCRAGAATFTVVLIASLFEKRAPGVYHNTAAIFDSDGALRGIYRKMHIPDDPLYYEKFYFTPGDLGLPRFRHRRRYARDSGLLGPVVSGRRTAHGAAGRTACSFIPPRLAGIPRRRRSSAVAQHDAWRTIQRAHAIANGVYVAVVNRVGFETGDIRGNAAPGDGLEFWGGSFLCDPFGRVIAEASHDKEEILIGEVDLRPWKIFAATGPSCATAASTATHRLPAG